MTCVTTLKISTLLPTSDSMHVYEKYVSRWWSHTADTTVCEGKSHLFRDFAFYHDGEEGWFGSQLLSRSAEKLVQGGLPKGSDRVRKLRYYVLRRYSKKIYRYWQDQNRIDNT